MLVVPFQVGLGNESETRMKALALVSLNIGDTASGLPGIATYERDHAIECFGLGSRPVIETCDVAVY